MMKRWILAGFMLVVAMAAGGMGDVQAEAGAGNQPLCLPVEGGQGDCLEVGPNAYLNELAQQGIIMPRNPLPARVLDSVYSELPYNYVRLRKDEVPIFSTLEDAMSNQNAYRSIPPGFAYASYVDLYQGSGDGKHYMIEPGMWVRGGHTSGRIALPEFVGLLFAGTPAHKFGWVIYETESQIAPGLAAPAVTGHILNRFDIIQVYQTIEMDGTKWLMIGPDEWIDTTKAALVYPVEGPPEGVENGRWIEVNLFEQTIAVYQDNRLLFATLTSTGIPGWWTQPGLFQVTEKLDSTPMSGAFEADRSDYYYLEDVPWTMYFDQARALHGAYWHSYYGYEQSHGCVNISPGDAHWLYLWGNVGDWVYVWDPSGKTPTDPEVYTDGGA